MSAIFALKGAVMKSLFSLAATFGLVGLLMGGCATSPDTESGKANLSDDSVSALNRMETQDPSLKDFVSAKHAFGYAIFPSVGKGAVGVGGAYGKGTVYVNGDMIGYADLTQATIGVQLGGQNYSELLAFESEKALNDFKSNNYTLDAQASAVALKSGASADAKYSNGVAVFTLPEGGLMFEAAIGGQRFTYQAK
jgi:lipid-binding SYLF domain-containing protein